MSRYYFVVLSLPPLQFGSEPELSYKELRDTLEMNLSSRDIKKFQLLLQPIDIYNVKAFWLGLPLDDRGTIPTKELEESLLVREHLPEYLVEFLDRYDSVEERLKYFASLYASMCRQSFDGFLGWYVAFERETRLVLTALRAKQWGKDLVRELQFEDPKESFVAEILAQKDAPDYAPPQEYEELKTLFVENFKNPQKLCEAILKYRFNKIGEWEERENFTLDQILAYTARLLILERFIDHDKEKAKEIVEELSAYG